MQNEFIDRLIDNALKGEGVSYADALRLETLTHDELEYLFEGTDKIRDRFKGKDVKICSIVNAKSGRCVEDCSFCAQSSQFETDSPEYELMDVDEIVAAAKEAEAFGSNEFSIVTSGTAMRGWQARIARTSVVPDRSDPIMNMGRSSRVTAIFKFLRFSYCLSPRQWRFPGHHALSPLPDKKSRFPGGRPGRYRLGIP